MKLPQHLAEEFQKWHVINGLMYPPVYRAEREGPGEGFDGLQCGPWFKTRQEAVEWIKENHPDEPSSIWE